MEVEEVERWRAGWDEKTGDVTLERGPGDWNVTREGLGWTICVIVVLFRGARNWVGSRDDLVANVVRILAGGNMDIGGGACAVVGCGKRLATAPPGDCGLDRGWGRGTGTMAEVDEFRTDL